LPREEAAGQPVEEGVEGARQREAVATLVDAHRQLLAVGEGLGLLQLDFIEIAVQAQLRHAVALGQQALEHRLVAGDAELRIAVAPLGALGAVAHLYARRQGVDQQLALLVLVAAAVAGGAPHQCLHALQALAVGREDHHQLSRQQSGADAGAVGAAGARIDQHVAEVARQVVGETAEQRRTAVEQLVPVQVGEALAVTVVEQAGAHQVQRAALVDARHILLPVDGGQHFVGQLVIVERGALAAQQQLLAAGLEKLHHAGAGFVLVEIMVQSGRFQVPVDHQDGHGGVLAPRQHHGDIRQRHRAPGAALVGIERNDFAGSGQRRQ